MLKIMLLAAAIVTAPQLPSLPADNTVQPPAAEQVDCESRTFASADEAMQSGCCSWHGGVCGCSNGRKKCCDGKLSPSCTC